MMIPQGLRWNGTNSNTALSKKKTSSSTVFPDDLPLKSYVGTQFSGVAFCLIVPDAARDLCVQSARCQANFEPQPRVL